MNMITTYVGVLALTLLMGQGPGSLAHPEIDFQGKLYRAVFVSGPGVLSSGDIAQAPEPLRGRLSRFLTRRVGFQSQYQGTPADVDGVARDAKRREIERAIDSLIETEGIEQQAVAFVKDAPIAHEWEGKAEGPLAESAFAEQFLQKNPSTPLAPYLDLFIAQRLRTAAEAAELGKDEAMAKAAAAKARDYLQKARAAKDPIFGLIADDLQRVPYVYVKKTQGA